MRAWSVGAAPAAGEMTLDLDSTVCEVCGTAKHGAAYGHTKVLGYHPLVAVRSDTGEVLHSRMRSGSSQRGNAHFARESLARVAQLTVAATIRDRLLTVAGRLVNHSGRHRLRLPLNWPWQNTFTTALDRIRSLPLLI